MQVWLPPWRHVGRWVETLPGLGRHIDQATRLADVSPGEQALMADMFPALVEPLPAAALTRHADAPADCAGRWLRVDPCHLRVEVSGVRMLACGSMQLSIDEARALADSVRPLFDDVGWRFEVTTAERWYAQPDASHESIGGDSPERVLGAHIDAALPSGDAGRTTRRWLNELQMALHDHPVNRSRQRLGLPEVNSLWLHGDGTAPVSVSSSIGAFVSQDPLLIGLASIAGIPAATSDAGSTMRMLVDVRDGHPEAVALLARAIGRRAPLDFAFESGERLQWRPWHRLRFWRNGANA